MRSIDIANGLLFQALNVSKDTFDDRLLIQKKVFLLKELGVDFGYSFNWYVHGPYSPNLTAYIYNNLDLLKEYDFSDYQFSDTVREKINLVQDLENKKPDSLSAPSWYELLASVSYLQKRLLAKDKNLVTRLKELKPQYNEDECAAAVAELKNIGIGLQN